MARDHLRLATNSRPRPDVRAGGKKPPRQVVIVGAGFSGYFAARSISRKLGPGQAHVTLISDLDGLLYQPLLPEVAVGSLDARTIAVPLTTTLKAVTLVRGRATRIDTTARTVMVDTPSGTTRAIEYDHLLITAGSVSRVLDIPGLAAHGVGFKTAAQALYLRDLVLARIEAANDEPDLATRKALLSFVVVGAGYAGTELTAQMARMTARLSRRFDHVERSDITWTLLDMAPQVMPELGATLGDRAVKILRKRGVDVRLRTSITRVTDSGAYLTDGSFLRGATVVWCAGVTPSPIVAAAGLTTVRGRIVVDADMGVPGHAAIYAAGDAAAVPDTTRPRNADGTWQVCPPTAQHAMRQGHAVARNIVADIHGGRRRPYRHRDLGLVVDLGGSDAVARPLGVPISGPLAKLITRGYHLYALPTVRRRARALTNWALAGRHSDDVSVGLPAANLVLARAEHPAGRLYEEEPR